MQLGTEGNELFTRVAELDQDLHRDKDFLVKWMFVDKIKTAPHIVEMNFFDYEGPSHILKFINWIDKFHYADWFLDHHQDLVESSIARDLACLDAYDLTPGDLDIRAIGAYNAQDYVLQRFYPVPDAQRPRVILDFGGGHGRMANLAFRPEEQVTETMIVVDGIPSPYLTQRAYFAGLGLRVADYLEHRVDDRELDVASAAKENDVVHLPTWRMDLIPDSSVDMVCCVQVLKELPRRLVVHVIQEFARVLKPGGAVYVRDALLFHHPNMMPNDMVLRANGFVPEFTPRVRDRVQIHGVPRIWRKLDYETLWEV
jgi:SAM-dependent methyltransferase